MTSITTILVFPTLALVALFTTSCCDIDLASQSCSDYHCAIEFESSSSFFEPQRTCATPIPELVICDMPIPEITECEFCDSPEVEVIEDNDPMYYATSTH